MVKVIISFLTFSALIVTATSKLLDNAFTPVATGISTRSVIQTLSTLKSLENKGPSIDVVDLNEADFIPQPKVSIEAKKKTQGPNFLAIKKSYSIKSLNSDNKMGNTFKKFQADGVAINGSEPIKLSGFKVSSTIKISQLAKNFKPYKFDISANAVKIAATKSKQKQKNSKNVDKSNNSNLDRISTSLAATEKSNQVEEVKMNIDMATRPKDELVFFDYSKPSDKSLEKPTSKTNLGIHSKNEKGIGKKNEVLGEILKGMGKKFKSGKPDVVASADTSTRKEKAPANKESFAFTKSKSSLRVTSHGHSLLSSKSKPVTKFDIRFADNRDAVAQSESDGSVLLESELNSEYSIRRGVIFSSGYLPTSVDLVLEEGNINLGVPLLSKASFNAVVEKRGLRALGTHVLVELDELTEDADFDVSTGYESKLFLDRNLNIVDRGDSEYAFILFIGVEPGNRILSFKTYKNEVTSKIVHLVQDELYFDFNFYHKEKNDFFGLYEDNLLSQENSVLSLDENQIVDLAYESKIDKKTVNEFSISKALYSVGTRKYYELRHQEDSLFIGRWNDEKIYVPSEGYKRFALASFELNSLNGHCMVQINLSKQAKSMSFNGSSFRGQMRVDSKVLDTDGIFYRDLSNQSKKIFLLGEEQGTINIEITYADDTVDYLQSFCSQSNYLVEQL
ncbi:MAG: hypothetical protein CME64_06955 [Halobacteriovoraceae bacterium]|nr:hypothetical protein [Halobacteriovoraceae bacterium]|tara:strand:+ start:11146 stop:13176 length:2031 start_codon:yes stop_codon:yes gene_type:complete